MSTMSTTDLAEAARQRELLVDCYLSGQMSAAQWNAHAIIEPELEVLLARRRGQEVAPCLAV